MLLNEDIEPDEGVELVTGVLSNGALNLEQACYRMKACCQMKVCY